MLPVAERGLDKKVGTSALTGSGSGWKMKKYKDSDWLRGNIQESEEIAETDKGLLLDYSRDLRLNGHSDARNYKLVIHMKKVAENSDVSLKKAGKEDVKDMVAWVLDRDLSSETVRDYKIAIRVFYKWLSNGVI
ncbi:hypothetical protein AKJ54_00385 [candidate division MSBL1 archaeon SCGC-AAA382K21]|uniref:Core-binding (CB) domain-containing protein n=1 Tax=candidate division MSBL1 archaeon SCGC-AAA382K21 TaxID=1698283 RepID=A0A133VLM7_9EURY|nr:hypothetical protein AKJ54_00385 [candidate division MSBL1 archaeon SCGC-AAA382K21]